MTEPSQDQTGRFSLPHPEIPRHSEVGKARRMVAENLTAIADWVRGLEDASIGERLAGADTIDRFAEEVDVP